MALSGPLQLWPLSLLLYSCPELHWNTVDSNETNEIVSFGDGDKFQTRHEIVLYGGEVELENIVKRDIRAHLIWRLRKLSYGVGAGAHSTQTS